MERLHALPYQLDGETWEELLRRCAALKFRCAIVGAQGSGKTTLMIELSRRLKDVEFVDDYDSLSAVKRFSLRRQHARLIVSSHQPCALPTLILCQARAEVLGWAAEELSGRPISIEAANALLDSHNRNLRHALRHLYDEASGDRTASIRMNKPQNTPDGVNGIRDNSGLR